MRISASFVRNGAGFWRKFARGREAGRKGLLEKLRVSIREKSSPYYEKLKSLLWKTRVIGIVYYSFCKLLSRRKKMKRLQYSKERDYNPEGL